MRVRALDNTGDWLFGKGQNDYKQNNAAVAQLIQTRLMLLLGECFFATNQGVDWFNLLGGKDQQAVNLAVSATILNTPSVINLIQTSISLDDNRKLTITYSVNTTFTGTAVVVTSSVSYILTEDGFILTTESGDQIYA
jgi:hypothetical protein